MTQAQAVAFSRATKHAAKLRMAIDGPAGAGKTYTALAIATTLARPVALVDTEHGSASKYADLFEFDTLELDSFHPARFIEAIDAAEAAGFGTIILDSLSHAWSGKGGTLELVDRATKRSQSGNSFTAWKDVTPIQNALIERILTCRLHVIVTLRVKTEYVIQTNDKGRQEPRKVGLAPVQRDQLEYEFDVYGRLDQDNTLVITKTRCPALTGGLYPRPGVELAQALKEWLQGTTPQPEVEMVRSADSGIWKRWLELKGEADALGVPVAELRLPVPKDELVICGHRLSDAIEERKYQLASEDVQRANGKAQHETRAAPPPSTTARSQPGRTADAPPAEAVPPGAGLSRSQLWAERRNLEAKAPSLGVTVDTLDQRITDEALADANATLREQIKAAEKPLAGTPEQVGAF